MPSCERVHTETAADSLAGTVRQPESGKVRMPVRHPRRRAARWHHLDRFGVLGAGGQGKDIQQRQHRKAAVNVIASLVLGIAAAALGRLIGAQL